MSLVTWSPFREFEDIFNRFGVRPGTRLISGDADENAVVNWRPTANISETDKEYLIKAELPEVDKKDVEVSVQDGVITISGERRYEKSDDSEQAHRIESFYGSFSRSFSLPADVDEDNIKASSKDGVLTVRVPKLEVQKAKKIDVSVS